MHRSSNICKILLPGHFMTISWVFSEALCSFTFLCPCRDPLWWRVYLGEPPAVLPWPTEHQLEGHFGSTQHRHQTPTAASCPELWAPSQPANPSQLDLPLSICHRTCSIATRPSGASGSEPTELSVVWDAEVRPCWQRSHRCCVEELVTWGVPPLPSFCVLVKYDIPQTGLGAMSPCPALVTV